MNNATSPDATLMCLRNAEGRIETLTRQALSVEKIKLEGWQAVSISDAEVQVFTQEVSSQTEALKLSDSGLVRVVEDLIDVLINRGVFLFTDLPEAVQFKLMERRQTRASMGHRLQPTLLDDDNGLL
jgi:hypothetical protein